METIAIKKFEDLSDLEKLGVVDFSYSRLDTYKQCPSKYFFSYITKEPRQFNPPAVLGNIVHEVLETTLEDGQSVDLNTLKTRYEEVFPEWDPDNIISQDLIQVGRVILDEFYDAHEGKKFNIYDKEMAFDFIIGLFRIRGFIDRVDVVGNRVNITDYKTGKWEVALKNVPQDLQLGIYALAVSLLFPDKEIYAELYYLRSGKKKGHLFTQEEIESVKFRIISDINKVINDMSFKATTNTHVCSYCDHAKSGACGVGVFRNSRR